MSSKVHDLSDGGTLQSTDEFYIVRSPFTPGNDYRLPSSNVFPSSSTDNAIVRFDGTSGTKIQNSSISINDSGCLLNVDGSVSAPSISFSGDTNTGIYRVTAASNSISGSLGFTLSGTTRIVLDTTIPFLIYAYAANPSVQFRRANGTESIPTAVQSGDTIFLLTGRGYGATQYQNSSDVTVQGIATQNFTDTAHGCYLTMSTTPNGSISRVERIRIGQDGNIFLGSSTNAVNRLDISGGMVVGASYAGTNTAATNGILVQGDSAFGATSVGTANYLFSKGAAQTTFRILSTNTTSPILSLQNASAEHQLFIDSAGDLYFWASANLIRIDTTGNFINLLQNLKLNTVGKTLFIKEGSNAKMGVATLVGGTVTVSTTAVTASSRIFITVQSLGTIGVPTSLAVTARTAGTSFTITSLQATDTSTVAWVMFEPT